MESGAADRADLLRLARDNDMLRKQNSDLAKINASYATKLRDSERDKLELAQSNRELRTELARIKSQLATQRHRIRNAEEEKRLRLREDVACALEIVSSTLKCAVDSVGEAMQRLALERDGVVGDQRRSSIATSVSSADSALSRSRIPEIAAMSTICKSPVRFKSREQPQERIVRPDRLARIIEVATPSSVTSNENRLVSKLPNGIQHPVDQRRVELTLGKASTPEPRRGTLQSPSADLSPKPQHQEGTVATPAGDSTREGKSRDESALRSTRRPVNVINYAEPSIRTKLRRGDKPPEGQIGWTSSSAPLGDVTNTRGQKGMRRQD